MKANISFTNSTFYMELNLMILEYFCFTFYFLKNNVQHTYDFVVHCATKSHFHCTFFIDTHLHNKIVISFCTFFTNPVTQQKHTSATLAGCEKMYNGIRISLHNVFCIFTSATKS